MATDPEIMKIGTAIQELLGPLRAEESIDLLLNLTLIVAVYDISAGKATPAKHEVSREAMKIAKRAIFAHLKENAHRLLEE